ncbi:hypothetical protein THASP1DRAFT_26194, partial [Thamnocephalis sphaerospora]
MDMSQSRDIKAMLDFVFCWTIYPALEPGVGPALHQRVNSLVADAEMERARAALHAIQSSPANTTCSSIDLTGDGDNMPSSPVGPGTYELTFRKLFAGTSPTENYDALLPLLRSRNGVKPPTWFTRCLGRYLTYVLLSKHGVYDLLVYMFDGEAEASQAEVDNAARLLLSLPQKTKSRRGYYTAVFAQLVSLVSMPAELPDHIAARPVNSKRAAAQLVARFIDAVPELCTQHLD